MLRRLTRPLRTGLSTVWLSATYQLDRLLDPASVYRNIVRHYGLFTGINVQVNGLCVHSLRADGRHQRAFAPGRHRQSSGMARS